MLQRPNRAVAGRSKLTPSRRLNAFSWRSRRKTCVYQACSCNGFLHYRYVRYDGGAPNDDLDRHRAGAGYVPARRAAAPGDRAGEKIEVEKLPDGRVSLKAARAGGTIGGFLGLLAGKTRKVASLDEIDDVTVDGWAGRE